VRHAGGRLAVLDLGGGGIHFPTLVVRSVDWEPPSQRGGHRVPCPPALRHTRGILDASVRGPVQPDKANSVAALWILPDCSPQQLLLQQSD
jgi:hypothetical protein